MRSLLRASLPKVWPALPPEMSFSLLSQLETCPHRWALSAADYPEVWAGRGYPPRLNLAAITGIVVHAAVQQVIDKLASAESVHAEQNAVTAMRELGGYTALITSCINTALRNVDENPRIAPLRDYVYRTLSAKIPEMRAQVQTLVRRINVLGRGRTMAHDVVRTAPGRQRSALSHGTYTELVIRAAVLGWKAKVDLLTLSPQTSELVEFKTGVPAEQHEHQLRIYALLWRLDTELNPVARAIDRLRLCYRSGDVPITPPTSAEFDALEQSIRDRTNKAKTAAAAIPPLANPGPDRCRSCHVRHLCTTYWSPRGQQEAAVAPGGSDFHDVELTIQRAHGACSWDAEAVAGPTWLVGKQVLLRATATGMFDGVMARTRVRLLDAHVKTPEVDDNHSVVIVTLGTLGELFVVVT